MFKLLGLFLGGVSFFLSYIGFCTYQEQKDIPILFFAVGAFLTGIFSIIHGFFPEKIRSIFYGDNKWG